jgi:hypothetical protein
MQTSTLDATTHSDRNRLRSGQPEWKTRTLKAFYTIGLTSPRQNRPSKPPVKTARQNRH